MLDFLGNILDYINPFSENFILKGVLDFLGQMLSYINPLDENFFGYKLIELLGDLLKALFVPSESRITALTNTVSSKFDFVDSIKSAINSLKDIMNGLGNSPSVTFSIGSTKYTPAFEFNFNMSWFAPFKPWSDLIITGFVYASFLWRTFIKLPSTLSGAGGEIEIIEKRGREL